MKVKLPDDRERRHRKGNIASFKGLEADCPECKTKGTIVVKDTRIAGVDMNRHITEGHDFKTCSCQTSTVAKTIKCIRCGGHGTIVVR